MWRTLQHVKSVLWTVRTTPPNIQKYLSTMSLEMPLFLFSDTRCFGGSDRFLVGAPFSLLFSFSSHKNYNLALFIVGISTPILSLLIHNFVFGFFIEVLFVSNSIFKSQFTIFFFSNLVIILLIIFFCLLLN
jgi:hypothetical protein